jgi:hypothetical protein
MDNNILKLALDLGRGSVANYSNDDANEALRKAFMEIAGTDKIDYKTMRRFKPELFDVIEITLDRLLIEGISSQFDNFVEIRNTAWGDSNVFTVDDPTLFKVATIADGTGNIRRQRIDNGSFTVTTNTKAVKIYDELYRFLAGRINWATLVQRVNESYQSQIKTDIYTALYNSYDDLSSTYAVTGTYSESALITMVGHVEAACNREAEIMGTKAALAKITSANVSENMKDAKNNLGYYGTLAGTRMVKIPQAHTPGTETFAINDSFLLVLPTLNDKMVKLVLEGDAVIQETMTGNADKSIEYEFIKKAGIAVVPSVRYGINRLS